MLTGGPGRPCRPVKPRCPFCPLSPASPASPLSPRGPWGPWEQSVVICVWISRVNLSLVAKPIFFCLFRPEIIQDLACSFVSLRKKHTGIPRAPAGPEDPAGPCGPWNTKETKGIMDHTNTMTIILTFNNLLVEISLIITVSFIFKI